MAEITISKNYDAAAVEQRVLDKWMAGQYYRRTSGMKDCTIVIPPPNVTGVLHIGHALDDTIQDTLVRMNRMRGISTRWILGTDHAGIATQTRVDRKLADEGVSRREIGREKFLEACWDWTREYGGHILEQIKRMGCSADFSDPHFTMDPDYAHAVRRVFCDWYHDGLIYRGERIVNWCPTCTTAIADDEAEYQEEDGFLWYLRYPLKEPIDGCEYVVVATTRPETMLGDTGVAVSPKDHDKEKFIGAQIILPIVNREIPIFSDFYVDAGFGTGFVKVTPAHDPNDFGMGERHDLSRINIFDETAHVVEGLGEFSGMSREECREAVVSWFDKHGLLDHVEEHHHSVMHCYRCDTTLEPWLSEQWFVAVDRLKKPATEAVTSGAVSFHPARWTQSYLNWMENLKDWCISRQLWWGHRIPVFYCDACDWSDALMEDVTSCPYCGARLRQDEDVLDTWFSSQLWTFATQGWPQYPELMEGHHPTTALVTARDIIALWVARMIMASVYFCKEIPFHDVVIYATILAKDGTRMSKSKGNGVDPMDLIEMYGADAMRFNLLMLVTNNQDVRFDADIDKKTHKLIGSPRTEQARAFVTKIWNASRFVLNNLDNYTPGVPSVRTQADAWIFSRLARLSAQVTRGIENYQFGEVARELNTFFWNEFCDWYIEFCKADMRSCDTHVRLQTQRNLVFVLDQALRLLHPAMPFVTEAIWEQLPLENEQAPALMVAAWPEPESLAHWINDTAERAVRLLCELVGAVRSIRARYNIAPRHKLDVAIRVDAAVLDVLEGLRTQVLSMANVGCFEIGVTIEKPVQSAAVVIEGADVYIKLAGLVDIAAECARLEKEKKKLDADLAIFEKKLSNPGFLAKAAPEIIEKDRAKRADLIDARIRIEAQLADLG